jgi:hypothetical protein
MIVRSAVTLENKKELIMAKTKKATKKVPAKKTAVSRNEADLQASQNVRNLDEYKALKCNPRWWSISHINDLDLLKQIADVEQTPTILKKVTKRIARLEKRAAKEQARADKAAAMENTSDAVAETVAPVVEEPTVKKSKKKKK